MQYLSLLEPIFRQIISLTLPKLKLSEISLDYFDSIRRTQHCLTEQAWLEAFAKNLNKDLRECTTTVGIHRADVIFNYHKQAIFQQLSRGEWKILASSFLLSQGVLLQQTLKQSPIVLMDDFSSELDAIRRNSLIECIQQLNFEQCFISAVSEGLLHGKQALTIKL